MREDIADKKLKSNILQSEFFFLKYTRTNRMSLRILTTDALVIFHDTKLC